MSKENLNKESKLSKKDIVKAAVTWHATSHLTYNYQRMQGGAIATTVGPILNKLYPNEPEKVAEGLKRNMIFFNTEPRFGAIIPGMTIALEEALATEEDAVITADSIVDIKTSLMGPLAGIGDTVTAALFRPLVLSIALGWALQGNIMGAVFFSLMNFSYDAIVTYVMFTRGYKLGLDSIDQFLEGDFVKKLTTFLGIVGLFSLGAMIVNFVTIDAVFSFTMNNGNEFYLANVFNSFMPKLLPLLTTVFAWRLMKKKSVGFVLMVLFVLGFIGGALGLIG